jgi:predicted neuraminidase
MSRLGKESQRWSSPIEVAYREAKSFQNPVAFQVPSGRLWLLHTSQAAGQWQTNAEVEYRTSDSEGKMWSGAKTLFSEPGSFIRQPPILLSEKRWLLPLYYTPSRSITDGAESNYSVVKLTTDGGSHWKTCEIPKSDGLVQQSTVRLRNGRFIGFFRGRYADFVYKSVSEDGCAWTVPAPTQLPNNNSSVQAALFKDGSLAIVFNNSSSGTTRDKPRTAARKPLSIALSTNGGKTWPWVRDIETGAPDQENAGRSIHSKSEEYSYPSVLQDSRGQINVAYTYRHETIKVVRFSEDWIKNGSTIGQFKGDQKPR